MKVPTRMTEEQKAASLANLSACSKMKDVKDHIGIERQRRIDNANKANNRQPNKPS